MILEWIATGAWQSWNKAFACTLFTIPFHNIVILIWMFATAFEILRAVDGNISVISTLASWHFAFNFIIGTLHIVMILVGMITEAFRWRPYCFTINPIWIIPSGIQPVLCQFCIIIFILLKFLFSHQHTFIITNQITILYICIHMAHRISLPFRHFTQLHFSTIIILLTIKAFLKDYNL